MTDHQAVGFPGRSVESLRPGDELRWDDDFGYFRIEVFDMRVSNREGLLRPVVDCIRYDRDLPSEPTTRGILLGVEVEPGDIKPVVPEDFSPMVTIALESLETDEVIFTKPHKATDTHS